MGSEHPLDVLSSPGQLRKYFVSGERDVVGGPNPHVWPTAPQTAWHQLQLVIVHPHGGVVGGARGDRSEPLVDLDVGLPPLAVENRSGDRVVVQRALGGVAEASLYWRQPRLADDILTAVSGTAVANLDSPTRPRCAAPRPAGHRVRLHLRRRIPQRLTLHD